MPGPTGSKSCAGALLLLAAACLGWGGEGEEALIPTVEPTGGVAALLQDPSPAWTLGIAALEGRNLASENRYLLYSIPLLLKESLESVDSHRFDSEERAAYQRELHRLSLRLQSRRIEKIRDRREQDFWLDGDTEETFAEEIRRQGEVYDLLKQLPVSEVPFPREKPIHLKEGREMGDLLAPPQYSVSEYARKQALDVLVWGELEEIQEYLYLRVVGYHRVLDRELFRYEDAATVEELHAALDNVRREFGCSVRGGGCAFLTVTPAPADGAVEINGRWMGTGEVRGAPVEAGEAVVTVSRTGYLTASVQIDLAPGEEKTLAVELVSAARRTVSLTSTPPSAAVYLGAVWIGKTPLLLDVPSNRGRLVLKKEGYRDAGTFVGPASPGELSVSLDRRLYDEETWQRKRRDRFYASFAVFALSVPFPLYLYNYAVDNAYATVRTVVGSPEYDRLRRRTDLYYYGYLGTLYVSLTLFLNMGLDLWEYVKNAF